MNLATLYIVFAQALRAAAGVFEQAAATGGTVSSADLPAAAEPSKPAARRGPGRPAANKPAAAPAVDPLAGDGLDPLTDPLAGDGLDEPDPLAEPAAPQLTEKDLRAALIALQNKDGNTKRVIALLQKYIDDATKPAIIANLPKEQYAATIEHAKRLAATASSKK